MNKRKAYLYYRRQQKRRFLVAVSVMVLALTFVMIFSKIQSHKKNVRGLNLDDMYYTTYVVSGGDTLWSIAEEHIYDDFTNYQQYIAEMMRTNSLTSSNLYEGQLLAIPCKQSELFVQYCSDHN